MALIGATVTFSQREMVSVVLCSLWYISISTTGSDRVYDVVLLVQCYSDGLN